MGNEVNGTNDNDGWDHRGGGMLEHTGAAEYAALKLRLGYESDDVRDPGKAVVAACDYWTRKNVSSFVDAGDYKGARHAINGGYIGLDEVQTRRQRAFGVLL
jgi:putative chitinase